MARQIDFRSPMDAAADAVAAVMIDPVYLRARLEHIGGPDAALLEHTGEPGGARYRLRQGLDRSVLPPLVQNIMPGNLVIERTETVRRRGPGDHTGTVEVDVPGMPVSARGRILLRDTTPDRSEFGVQAEVTVNVPLFGGRIEETVVEQVRRLLAAETEFTQRYLREHPG